MKLKIYQLKNIAWITDDNTGRRHRARLPRNLVVGISFDDFPDDKSAIPHIDDIISDQYEFLHQGYSLEVLGEKNWRGEFVEDSPTLCWYNSTDSASGYDRNIPKSVFNPVKR